MDKWILIALAAVGAFLLTKKSNLTVAPRAPQYPTYNPYGAAAPFASPYYMGQPMTPQRGPDFSALAGAFASIGQSIGGALSQSGATSAAPTPAYAPPVAWNEYSYDKWNNPYGE